MSEQTNLSTIKVVVDESLPPNEVRIGNVRTVNLAVPETSGQRDEEITRLRDRVQQLEEALSDLLSWFPAKPSPPEWRLPGGGHGADEAVAAARALFPAETEK